MIVNMVHIWVKDAFVDAFIEASIENHWNTIMEPGNLRFDLLRDAENPAKFVFYEVFRDELAVQAHKNTTHYAKWRDKVAEWMDEPRKGIKHTIIAPENEKQWQTGSI